MSYDAERTIMGTWGTLFINDTEVGECTGLQAKATLNKVDIPMCGTLSKKYKISGWDGKGTLTLNKVSSLMARLIADNLKAGKETVCTIISKLADPSSDGIERVKLGGVKFDELNVANWSANKPVEEQVAFSFESFDYLDMI